VQPTQTFPCRKCTILARLFAEFPVQCSDAEARVPALCCSLREQDPNHRFLQVLKSKEHSGAVMYDERGEVTYARLAPTSPSPSENGSVHEPSAQARADWRPKSQQPSDVGSSGYGEGLKERIRADLERRRQQSGAPSRESAPGAPSEWWGGGGEEERGWRGGGQSVPRGEEGRGGNRGGALPAWQGTRDSDKVRIAGTRGPFCGVHTSRRWRFSKGAIGESSIASDCGFLWVIFERPEQIRKPACYRVGHCR
jgi:hypothetical protein